MSHANVPDLAIPTQTYGSLSVELEALLDDAVCRPNTQDNRQILALRIDGAIRRWLPAESDVHPVVKSIDDYTLDISFWRCGEQVVLTVRNNQLIFISKTEDENMATPPHIQRMIDEYTDLDGKIKRLEAFIDASPVYRDLPQEERQRMHQQSLAMQLYRSILVSRIQAVGGVIPT